MKNSDIEERKQATSSLPNNIIQRFPKANFTNFPKHYDIQLSFSHLETIYVHLKA